MLRIVADTNKVIASLLRDSGLSGFSYARSFNNYYNPLQRPKNDLRALYTASKGISNPSQSLTGFPVNKASLIYRQQILSFSHRGPPNYTCEELFSSYL